MNAANLTPGWKRTRAIGRAVERLDRSIARMRLQDKWLSNGRLATFFIGLGTLLLPWTAVKWGTFSGAVVLFVFWVVRHQQVHRRMKHYRIWRDLKKNNLARFRVRWNDLPAETALEVAGDPVTARDLELVGRRSLHRLLDVSISQRGSQRLADWLTCSDPDIETTTNRQGMVRELCMRPRFRDRLLLNFHLVSGLKMDSEKMTKWLNIPIPQVNISAALLISALLLSISLVLMLFSEKLPMPSAWMFTYCAYILFLFSVAGRLAPVLESAQWLDDEIGIFSRILLFLEQTSLDGNSRLTPLLSIFQSPGQRPSRKMRALKIAAGCIGLRNNPIMTFLLNMAFPWDLVFAGWTLGQRKKLKEDFPRWLEALADLEAMNSLANFSYIQPDACFPDVTDRSEEQTTVFNATALSHPLLDPQARVANDFAIENIGEIALITGSNMAGKSTFLKTVGINLILAYCGGPVHAASLRTGLFRIRTCIKIEDSLSDGISSFYAEVRRIRQILSDIQQAGGPPVLYFIDEILRGTNNRERLIGSTALVRALTRTFSTGLISTHDLELTSLASEESGITNYHFAENIKKDRMFFSYKLRQGPCPTTNALHIMRKEGLPIPP